MGYTIRQILQHTHALLQERHLLLHRAHQHAYGGRSRGPLLRCDAVRRVLTHAYGSLQDPDQTPSGVGQR